MKEWRLTERVWIPKQENSTDIEQFRTISLPSVKGKIFFSTSSRQLTGFLLKNKYIYLSAKERNSRNARLS